MTGKGINSPFNDLHNISPEYTLTSQAAMENRDRMTEAIIASTSILKMFSVIIAAIDEF